MADFTTTFGLRYWIQNALCVSNSVKFLLIDGGFNVGLLFVPALNKVGSLHELSGLLLLSLANSQGLDYKAFGRYCPFSQLFYLDLSGTLPASKIAKLFSRRTPPPIRIFKARGMKLTDDDIWFVLDRIGATLWSLDLRDNNLTNGIKSIIEGDMDSRRPPLLLPDGTIEPYDPSYRNPHERYTVDAPKYIPFNRGNNDPAREPPRVTIPRVLPDEADNILAELKEMWRPNLKGHNYLHHSPLLKALRTAKGITHLRLSGNKLTWAGTCAILRSSLRLQHFDIGSATYIFPPGHPFPSARFYYQPMTSACLAHSMHPSLSFLRIHHSLITRVPSITNVPHASLLNLLLFAEGVEPAPNNPPFHPDSNPHLQTLTLTHVPRYTLGRVTNALTTFLKACAEQELAIKQEQKRYANNPLRAPQFHTGLRVLRLEFADSSDDSPSSTPRASSSGLSVSEDPDADTFHEASQGDFSFFDGEGSGVNKEESSSQRRASILREKSVQMESSEFDFDGDEDGPAMTDVIAAMRQYRDMTRMQREAGLPDHGDWSGTLNLVY